MPTQQTILTFKEGVKALQQARDFASLRETIDRMVSLCPPEDVPLAKDAIARVIRTKQAEELKSSRGNPQVLDALDKKYRDLYIVLRTAQSKLPPTPPNALPNGHRSPTSRQTQMQRANPLAGLNLPLMVVDWLKSKKKYLLTGGAVMSTLGGAVLLYKYFNSDDDDKKSQDSKESNFDRTIRSIQKYRAFSQMANDPNFSGNFTEILDGTYSKKKKKVKKKDEPRKSSEWERNEKTLMKDMDDAFNSLATRPKLEYELPQLPAPKSINPEDVVGEAKSQETKLEKPKRIKKRKAKTNEKSAAAPSMPRPTEEPKKIKTRKSIKSKTISDPLPEKKVKKVEKVEKKSAPDSPPGRLIPIVKRTKRVKKVKA